mmetsp:Transcript_116077/g.369325  ORF Transcript_116077/g.369325 Transcript_116077/m.369325 type:complete len:89 (-) Transcript_116077:154-420(-)
MQKPGDAVAQFQQASSLSSLWSRLNAHKGLPFAAKAVAELKEDGRDGDYVGDYKLTVWNARWQWTDNVIFLTFLCPAAWVWMMSKVPK